jgi:3-oxoacyl-[acyl-carrier protein] reductase
MRRRRAGRIVNLSTVAVPLHLEGEAIYAASKAAVEELTRVLARELGELGVTVNAIGPSPIRTDLIAGVPDDKIQQIVARGALKRLGELDDVLAVLDFFLSPRAGFVTGQVVYLGGFG